MEIKVQPMGDYQTNCYIVTIDGKDLIIDPGVGATQWVKSNVKNPIAILNTHGHFDHVWSNYELQQDLNLKVYIPKGDNFMLKEDIFGLGIKECEADILVEPDEEFNLEGIKIKFHHFPGHTPGCSAIEIGNTLFSGDFIFYNSIGRTDFPYSNPSDMKKSINKILVWDKEFIIYPGHGGKTKLSYEKNNLKRWLEYI